MTVFDIGGLIGVTTILAAYAATTLGRLAPNGVIALALNCVGASLILLSLTQKFNLAAAIVEGAWALIAMVGLIRIALGRRGQ
ncbi:MAG TPA: hypothetical protein VGI95_11530 [Caulobacteraceae bacterium]|jgi:hypothetical protein